MTIIEIAAVLFVLHALVASIDATYFHLWKYKLHTHEDTLMEHISHTCRAWTMAAAAYLLFAVNAGGLLLWAAVAVLVIDLVIETWDVLIEKQSRQRFGGLSPEEYLVHAHSIFLYAACWTLAFVAKPATAWALSSPLILEKPYPGYVSLIGWVMLASSVIAGIQHTWFCLPKYRVTTTDAA